MSWGVLTSTSVAWDCSFVDAMQEYPDYATSFIIGIIFLLIGLSVVLAGVIRIITRNNNHAIAMKSASSESSYKGATFKTISGLKAADSLVEQNLDRAEVCRKDAVYASARSQMTGNTVSGYEAAIKMFSTISGWKDVDGQIYTCQRKIEAIKAKEEADRLELKREAEERRIAAENAAKKCKRTIAIVTPIIVACIVFVFVLTTVITDGKYKDAVSLLEKGDIINAYENLIALNGYKDSAEKAKEISEKYKIEKIKTASVGDIVYFGSYEQDNNTSNGREDIEWLVLAKEGDKTLVISKYALDCRCYHTSYLEHVTWETCSLGKCKSG